MRPIKLKMAAFGPYLRPVELDFEENLRNEKIFLINGATGAGKTTILDAMCFALYGTTSGDEREGNMMRSNGIPDKIKTEIEFTFALGEKIYTAHRILTRKSDKFNHEAELICDNEVIETKKSAVNNRIKELLGFNAEQFRQVVLLPQGEFKTFLTAKADDRQLILDALFNAEFYKRVEELLKEKADDAEKIFQNLNRDKEILENQLQGSKFNEDEIKKLHDELEEAQKKSVELKKISETAQEDFNSGKKLADDFTELENRANLFATAQNNLKQAEKTFSDAKTEYELRETEKSQRDKLKSELEDFAKIKKSLDELKERENFLDSVEKDLQEANDALKKAENNAKKYERRLLKLKNRREELVGAEKNLAEAKIISEKATEREKILKYISKLEKELDMERRKVSVAEKNFNEANLLLERLQKLQRDGSAALLAKNLKNGEPCPVCGSKIHPEIALSREIIPSDAEIDSAQTELERCKKTLDKYKISAVQIETALTTKRDDLKKYSDLPDLITAQKNFTDAQKSADELQDCEDRIKLGEKYIEENKSALKEAENRQKVVANEHAKRLGEKQIIQSQIPQNYLGNAEKLNADIFSTQKMLSELETAWNSAQKNFIDAGNKKSACEGLLIAAKKSFDELEDKLKGKKPPKLDTLKNFASETQKNYVASIEKVTSLKNNLENLEKLSAKIIELEKKIVEAEKNFRIRKKLSDAASGKILGKKISFARWYLRAMFAQVLTEANYRLEKMSDRRYWFKPKDEGKVKSSTAGLNLEIFDEYTGEARPIATLSGGESFLAALSLALGLAAVVRNNAGGIKLDTIFIDEGFGSLDTETLDFAIKTLIELQSGGRLVGIISHVEELKNRIPVRLEVTPSKTGSYAKFVS